MSRQNSFKDLASIGVQNPLQGRGEVSASKDSTGNFSTMQRSMSGRFKREDFDTVVASGIDNADEQAELSSMAGSPGSPGGEVRRGNARREFMARRASLVEGVDRSMTTRGLAWFDILDRYGGIQETQAVECAEKFSLSNLPPPSADANSYMTHEFLKELGIEDPSLRAKVKLAVHRMPEIDVSVDAGDNSADTSALVSSSISRDDELAAVSKVTSGVFDTMARDSVSSFSADTRQVHLDCFEGAARKFTWYDLRGRDGLDDAPLFDSKLAELVSKVHGSGQIGKRRQTNLKGKGGSGFSPLNKFANAVAEMKTQQESPTRNRKGTAPELALPNKKPLLSTPEENHHVEGEPEDQSIINSILNLNLPLPQMVVDPNSPSECAFVLRVCTFDCEEEDDSVRELTNRWTIYVNAARHIVATIHRVDSHALADMRDMWDVNYRYLSFKQIINKIFERFLQEYEKALVASVDWLDKCEIQMLSSTQTNSILRGLFHLQRRASVYDRMVDLAFDLATQDVGKQLKIKEELKDLSPRYRELKERCLDLQARSQNLLEIHLSMTGYHTNELFKVLTQVSMCFTPITFLAGIYGMNFKNMPELQYENAYYICLGCMALCVILVVTWFNVSHR